MKRTAERAVEETGEDDFAYVSSHDLRRRFAQQLLVDEQVNPRVVMQVGGWDSFQAIEPYLKAPTPRSPTERSRRLIWYERWNSRCRSREPTTRRSLPTVRRSQLALRSRRACQSISLRPEGDGEYGRDWVLTYTPKQQDPDDREMVLVRLTPRALHELYIETKGLSPDARQAGHTAECDFCDKQVDLEKAIPNRREEPVDRHCYKEVYGGPVWLE